MEFLLSPNSIYTSEGEINSSQPYNCYSENKRLKSDYKKKNSVRFETKVTPFKTKAAKINSLFE